MRRVLRAERSGDDDRVAEPAEDPAHHLDEAPVGGHVGRPVREADPAVRLQRDPVVVARQILRHRQPVDAALQPEPEHPVRDPRLHVLHLLRMRPPLRLELAERETRRRVRAGSSR